jgi:hypothetical protein
MERGYLGLASKQRSTVSPSLASKSVAAVLVVWTQKHSLRFPGLGLKTGSYSLVIWHIKSLRRFLGLGIKIKWAMICRLCHKTDGRMKTACGTHRDLVACFICKRVGLGFPSLALRLAEVRRRWCMWHHHRGHVEMKSSTPTLLFSLY